MPRELRLPLSPLIFALVLEPLALAILSNPDIKGIEVDSCHHKLCLFADDALMFVTSPRITLPNLILTLDRFAAISGLEVNQSKSIAFNVSLPPTKVSHLQETFSFQWTTSSLPYLGVKLIGDPALLYRTISPCCPICQPLWQLGNLCVFCLGRITALNMSSLPKILYLFRVLPIAVFSYFFHIIQS